VELSHSTGESVHLSVRNAFQVIIIDKVESDVSNRASFHIGRMNTCYSTGTGKILLAYMDEDEIEPFLRRSISRRIRRIR
jgi:DNA-binding IclR family transcriptional regulator